MYNRYIPVRRFHLVSCQAPSRPGAVTLYGYGPTYEEKCGVRAHILVAWGALGG